MDVDDLTDDACCGDDPRVTLAALCDFPARARITPPGRLQRHLLHRPPHPFSR